MTFGGKVPERAFLFTTLKASKITNSIEHSPSLKTPQKFSEFYVTQTFIVTYKTACDLPIP
jgi:hypothetical protein